MALDSDVHKVPQLADTEALNHGCGLDGGFVYARNALAKKHETLAHTQFLAKVFVPPRTRRENVMEAPLFGDFDGAEEPHWDRL